MWLVFLKLYLHLDTFFFFSDNPNISESEQTTPPINSDYWGSTVIIIDHLFGIVLACLTAIQEVPGSIPGYTLETFLEV